MFYAYINGIYSEINSGNVEWTFDEINSFNFKIPKKNYSLNYRDLYLKPVQIYYKEKLIISGYVTETPSLNVDTKNVMSLDIKCYDELGRLSCGRARTDGHYQDQFFSAVILDLINFSAGWVVNFVNFTDVKVTIDLRQLENLWGQITKLVKSVPSMHLRYGGVDGSGNYILEVGSFADSIEQYNLMSLSVNGKTNNIFKICESYGGFSSEERISLKESLSNPDVTSDVDYANYPIVLDTRNNSYYVENLLLADGCETYKEFDLQKTKNDEVPTNAERLEASYSLYKKTVRFLQDHDDYDYYSASIYESSIPRLGDKFRVISNVTESIYNSFTNRNEEIDVFEINEELKIVRISFDFSNTFEDGFMFDCDLTNGENAENYDSETEIYEELDKFDEKTNQSTIRVSPVVFVETTHTNASPPDCNVNGKTFAFVPTDVPSWATNVFYGVVFQSEPAIYTVTQNPSINPTISLQLCVDNWNTYTSLTIRVIFYYS